MWVWGASKDRGHTLIVGKSKEKMNQVNQIWENLAFQILKYLVMAKTFFFKEWYKDKEIIFNSSDSEKFYWEKARVESS